jgi:glutathione synthase/RimK-type ligase-like ATP-grasp enzyme
VAPSTPALDRDTEQRMDTPRVGLLVGRERSFPDALIAEVNARDAGVIAEYASVDITHVGEKLGYAVLIDRISHDVQCYQPYLKYAALSGVHVINNPFWRIADDKFFDTALASMLGVAVPKTVVLPSKSYGSDVTSASLHNLRHPLAWDRMVRELGFPMYMKPHWGGGWRDVYRVTSMDELWATFDRTDRLTMIVQEEIQWTQYVRCIVIGRENVLPALWNPSLSHFERYTQAAQTMPALSPELEARVVRDAKAICRALGYDMNTVEFAIRDGVPYAIDMMNSAPDFDITSLGEKQFRWTVSAMADLVVRLAKTPARKITDAESILAR